MPEPVYVRDAQERPLLPTSSAYTRVLLRTGKARSVPHPALQLIQLTRIIAQPTRQPVVLAAVQRGALAELFQPRALSVAVGVRGERWITGRDVWRGAAAGRAAVSWGLLEMTAAERRRAGRRRAGKCAGVRRRVVSVGDSRPHHNAPRYLRPDAP